MLKDILGRIDERLAVTGLTDRKASLEAGLSEDAIRNLRRAAKTKHGRKGFNMTTIQDLAPVLQTTVAWLMGEDRDGDGGGKVRSRTVRLVGFVGAGATAHFFTDQGDIDEVTAPDGVTKDTVCVEIRGDSLGSIFDRWLVFYDDVHRPVTAGLVGKLCVVGTADGRVMIKKLQKSSARGRYHLISNTEAPLLDVEIEWAARVKHMVPR